MSELKKISRALISVYHKDGLAPLVQQLHAMNIEICSTGGTQQFIEEQQVPVTSVESLTSYPSILGGRVKTLHPKIFGGILGRRAQESDLLQLEEYDIPTFDLVIVDLYPFEETVRMKASHEETIEKIDIGGISLIRAAAKNFNDVTIVSSRSQYDFFLKLLEEKQGFTTLEDRKQLAMQAFSISSSYDTAIHAYLGGTPAPPVINSEQKMGLRYGENPHQKASFLGALDEQLEQIHGKAISYNNLLDIDAAIGLMREFDKAEPCFAILKHNNACGVATRDTLIQAYKDALSGDPKSAFGGVLIANQVIDEDTAKAMDALFFEIAIAPGFENKALEILKLKKNRILLIEKNAKPSTESYRTVLNGLLWQEADLQISGKDDLKCVTTKEPSATELDDLLFAEKIVKHTKSNAIVLVQNKQLVGIGTGQTSRVDALNQAVKKAKEYNLPLQGAAMASDAFFPFPDCIEIASEAGIGAVIQPGGSIKDELSIERCNENNMAMVFTGIRHFKH